ncbi:dihydrofolate reductase [Arthrobacter zhangbolii]|mgnify:CR=1 FL=1|uniref:dihydrofolate reductase n=1 Tax=Arthrobacter zhangbolii TaxID=2886936 RepID=A0A9X1M871_9MICC|nr:dihydrofolate reductase [Arthrobacter zhangbolii]MCC3272660.1 dihydrofolate reductase [Arthrobacter zhangbolii]MCC3295080.1 dihydrofolate reductase [Arthrobacter zhangbolii]UON91498.1 dihydrofolate reductase [Arthrobacter zhangbolii]
MTEFPGTATPETAAAPAGSTLYYPVGGGTDVRGADLHQVLRARGSAPGNGPVIGLVWAQTADGVIGRDGGMPWHLPEDMAHFKKTTAGHPVIMGRRTWESFPAAYRPLPGRTNIIVSSHSGLADTAENTVVVRSLQEGLEVARTSPGSEEIWIIGGAQLYEAAVPVAHTAVVTVIDTAAEGDTYAPHLGADWTFAGVSPAAGWYTAANGTNYRIALWTRDPARSDVTDHDAGAPLT